MVQTLKINELKKKTFNNGIWWTFKFLVDLFKSENEKPIKRRIHSYILKYERIELSYKSI